MTTHVARAWGFILAVLFLFSGCGGRQEAPSAQPPPPGAGVVEVKMTTRQFAYEPTQIKVRKGDTVRVTLTSSDVTHGFAIQEYGINQQILPGREVTVEFKADQPGSFVIYCTVFCGAGHGAHRGLLIVEEGQ